MPLPTATCFTHAECLVCHYNPAHPSPALAPPDASHLLGAHQEADPLASVGVGGSIDVGVAAGGAGGAVGGQTGQVIVGAVVLGQLTEVLQPPLATQLKREQRLELGSLYGTQ